ncbi:hypothetical protein COV24_05195 [candidate division WWE3 bacterium CG10_big_fil_rev_8_21_14_0_10_32_10]|uniref:Class I SAM-dependent methyltransferase n=1 Tax=candidate division WWE3 bacterium CG10_big_fil_rev_8_21_14_0_10_32_10 TaxID=1975090 RepID=A0A2H0R916_UNCKA|nr:MAG: hypothetical protein COV24_05195 [candidate division WWE3 bacterium CG10_big_fil_rev_8_21_14_0_10_32_10]
MHIDGVDRPYYAYGLYQAALQARGLGIKRISAYEFGVAAGHGLVIMEKLADQVATLTGVQIDVYGFDLEKGLPEPADYRDLPYIWQKGFYTMNSNVLRKKLKKSTKLVLGNVSKTIPKFIKKDIAPIGFIAFDVDYYTSTRDAFNIFEASDAKMLPRIFCYFDDIIGTDEEIISEYVGELLAIKEFNKKHNHKKISKINGMFHKRVIKSAWVDMVYVMHNFKHKKYNTYIYPSSYRQNKL